MSLIRSILDFITALLKLRRAGDTFKDQVEIIYAIRRIVHELPHLNIERVLIMKSHNDNGEMNPLSYKYYTITYDDTRAPFTSVKDKYQKVPLDAEYSIMLSEVYQKKAIVVEPAALKEGLVKTVLSNEGVVYSQAYFIKHTRRELYYINIGTSKQKERFDTYEHKNELYLLIGKIRRLLKPY